MKFIKVTVPYSNREVWINVQTIDRFEKAVQLPTSKHNTNLWLRDDPDAWGISETVDELLKMLCK